MNGEYGVPRFWKMNIPEDIFFGIGHPPEENLLNIKEENKTKLRKIGLTYLKKDFLEKQSTLEVN